MAKQYMVFVKVNGVKNDYAVTTMADSAAAAEHKYLDKAISTRHFGYGVEGAMAIEMTKREMTETFFSMMMSAKTINDETLDNIINMVNEQLKIKDEEWLAKVEAEAEMRRLEKEMKEMRERMAQMEIAMKAAQNKYNNAVAFFENIA